MFAFRTLFEAAVSGLWLALVAPPLAATAFGIVAGLAAIASGRSAGAGLDEVVGAWLLLGMGAYLLGAVPAFVAGLALPLFRQRLSPTWAAGATGAAGVLVYLATFGAHLLSIQSPTELFFGYVLPAFVGVAVAALLLLRKAVWA